MSFYPDKVTDRFSSHANAGDIRKPSAVGTAVDFTCGISMRFLLGIDDESKNISDTKFKTNGCGYVIAAADLFAEKIKGKNLTELEGLGLLESEMAKEFGEIPDGRQHCLNLCFDALHNALKEYRLNRITEWTGDTALICSCFGMAEDTIETLIRDGELKTVEEVSAACNAGTGCGSCQFLIQEIIDSFNHD